MYHNMIEVQGPESFFQAASKAGLDSVLIADLPSERIATTAAIAGKHGIAAIFMLSALTSPERRALVLQNAQGFIYLTSGQGLASKNGEFTQDLGKLVREIKSQTTLPLCAGLSSSNPQQARSIIATGADGLISGSRVIEIIDYAREQGNVLQQLNTFLTSMLSAIND
jgi:tryptophan synthase alpha chain